MIKRWLKNILLALDQLVNAILLGDPDETISSRAGKAREKGKRWGCVLCAVLDRLDKNHCAGAIERDEGRGAVFHRG